MAQNTSWKWIEHNVLNRLNLFAGETASATDALFAKTSALTTNDIALGDNRWSLTAIRFQIVDVVLNIVEQICLSESDPRRIQYRKVTNVEHGGLLPTSLGGYGSFLHDLTPEDAATRVSLKMRAVEHVEQVRGFPSICNVGTPTYIYAIDGSTLISTVTPVIVEHFDFDRPAKTPSAVTALFASFDTTVSPNRAPIDDEFAEPAAAGATALLAMNVDGMRPEAEKYLSIYISEMEARGLKPMMIDLPPKPKQ